MKQMICLCHLVTNKNHFAMTISFFKTIILFIIYIDNKFRITNKIKRSLRATDDTFKVVSGCFDIHCNCSLFYILVTDNYHNVCWTSKLINECCKLLIFNNHWLELEVCLYTTKLKLLDYITNFLKSMHIFMSFEIMMWNHKESRSFKQDNFICIYSFTELF